MTNEEIQEMVAKADAEYDRLKDRVHEQYDEIKRLTAESTKWESKFYDEAKKVDKAIEYIENNFISYEDSRTFGGLGEEIDIQVKEIRELLNILKGVDKE